MSLARARALVFAATAAFTASISGHATADDDDARVTQAADRLVAAVESGDAAVVAEIAAHPTIEPHVVADAMLHRLSREPGGGARSSRLLAAAAELAERAKERPEARGLPSVVEEWKSLSADDLARELRLREVHLRVRPAQERKDWRVVTDLVAGAERDLAAARPSAMAVDLRLAQALAARVLGRLDDAVAAYGRAAAAAQAMRWPRRRAFALQGIGLSEEARGRADAAVSAYEEALAIVERCGPPQAVPWNLRRLATRWAVAGRMVDALAAAERALAEEERLGRVARVAETLLLLGSIRNDLGRHDEARALFERARAKALEAGDRVAATKALAASANARFRGKDFVGAQGAYRQAQTEAEAAGDAARATEALMNFGTALREGGDPRAAVDVHRRAVEAAASDPKDDTYPFALAALGADHLRLEEAVPAIDALGRALLAAEANRVAPWRFAFARQHLAEAYLLADRPREALVAAQLAAAARRGRARGLGEDFGETQQRSARNAADVGFDAALRWAEKEPASRREAARAAFALGESVRAMLLVDAIADSSRALPAEEAQERALRTRFESARTRVLEIAFAGTAPAQEVAAAQAEYEAASDARREAIARAHARRQASRRPAEPLALEAVQASMPDDAALLLYASTRRRTLVSVVTAKDVDLVDLAPAGVVQEKAPGLIDAFETPDGDEGDGSRLLYDVLLAPLEDRLPDGSTLFVARDGRLSFLPFEALVREREGRRTRAVESWAFAYVPSATVYATRRRADASEPPGDRVIALGDPVYPGEGRAGGARGQGGRDRGLASLDRLLASGTEAKEVAAFFPPARRTLLLREHATRERLLDAIDAARGRLRVLHLACHGFADGRLVGRSGLVLSGSDVLTVDDLSAMRVEADLVVLSACESGRGATRRGEGSLGLPRAFLAAGARRVVAADRPIDDEDARLLLRSFYEAHVRDGLEPAAALRAAKVARLREGGAASHPYAWASFVLWD